MKYTNKKKLIAVMTLLIIAASFSGCNSSNTAAIIDPEVTSSEIVSSEETSSEAVSSAPVSSEEEKAESETASSEATSSSEAEVSSESAVSSAPAVASEPAVSSAPAAVSEPAATVSSVPVESVAQTSSAPSAETASAPAQQQNGTTKAFEDMTMEEQDQWMLDQLNEQFGNIEAHEYGTEEANSAESTQPAESAGDVYEAIRLINEERVKAGLNELEVDGIIMEMAAVRAKEQAITFGHTRPDGSAWFTIEEEYGQRTLGAENAAAGMGTARGVVDSWMASEGHKANILNTYTTRIGVGYYYDSNSQYGHYWAMLVLE